MNKPGKYPLDARVAVRSGPPEPHCRTPFYLRGQIGTIEADLGCFRDPSLLAFHKPGLPMRRLYRVRFNQGSLWPEYGSSKDTLTADLYEHWLEPVEDASPRGKPHAQ